MGLYEQAIAQYDAALRINPTSSLYSNMGLAYMRLGQLEKAEEAYRNAIRCDEKNAFAWNNLSTLYFRQGDYAQALEYAKSAIAINVQMPQALGCAAVCSAMLGNEEE
jgi:tetratricopeptide (TPR) repeat protein